VGGLCEVGPQQKNNFPGKSKMFQISKTRFQLVPNKLQNIGEGSRLIRQSGEGATSRNSRVME